MSPDVVSGFAQAAGWLTLLATAFGVLFGLIVGMIPGLTISTGIIVLLPATFALPPEISIALLLGVYVGGMTGGSFSAILLNIPGTPSAAATVIDGYQLARRGEAGRALSISITTGVIGGLFSFFCLYFIAPTLADVALLFRSQDMFAVLFFSLVVICTFSARSLTKGLLAAAIGLAIATIGQDPVMGTQRFTFGASNLLGGVHFLSAMIGLFAVPQLIDDLNDPRGGLAKVNTRLTGVMPRADDFKATGWAVTIGCVIGTFIGILPGAGGPAAAFVSYDYARKLSRHPERFGRGSLEGVAAPETANNAQTGGALIPMMTLGIPGDPITAILIGALIIHGLAPGPLLFMQRGDFAYGMMFSLFWANIFGLIISLAGLRLLVKGLALPRPLLMPAVAVLCVIGSYTLRNNVFDVYVMLFFGLLGLAMRWLDMPILPLLLALVLGKNIEEHLRVALTSSRGDVSIFFTSPICLAFLCLAAASVAWSLYSAHRVPSSERRQSAA